MSALKRVRTPTVLQLEVVECGAACLAMVLAYYGRVVALEELREACGVSRDGSKASSILKASRRYGLIAKGFKKEPDQLTDLPTPLIAFWNFNHFVVIEGVGKDTVWLNDPAVGPRKVTRAEFNECFTGVVLAFEPGEDFQKGGDRPSPLRSLVGRLAGTKAALSFAVIASLALVIPGLVVPSLARLFVDYYLIERLDGWLAPLAIGVFAAAAMRAALTWLQQRYLGRMAAKLALAGASRLAWRVVRLPLTFFAQRSSGEIGSRISLSDRLAGLLAGGLALNCLNLISLIVYAAVMAQYDAPLTLLAIAFGVTTTGALWLLSRRIADVSQRQQLDEGKLLSTTIQGLSMVDSFKATGTEDLFFSRWAGAHAKVVNAEQDLGRLRRLVSALPLLFVSLSNAAILLVGGLRVMEGAITIGMLAAFQTLAASFFAPLIGLVGFGAQIQETRGALARLEDIESQPLDRAFTETAGAPPPNPDADAEGDGELAPERRRLTGRMEARDLSFGYAPLDPPIVAGFSFTLEPGARVALVGGSGGGKSTVGKLLAGLHPLWGGEILLDGRPLVDTPRAVLRGSLAYVDQEVAIFEGSIRDNITLWDDTLPEERVIAAAKDALIHPDIMMRPGGYAHMVEEGGRNFSGGQRQRLALARALALDPSIILLDEATSALDSEVERQFMENLRRRGCACVIIAHRLSTIRDCDEILVLSQGRIIERGRHETLMAAGGAYKTLVES